VLLTVDLERLDVQPGETLLDAGCGEGRHCFGALERGARVVGLDLDIDSLRPAAGGLRNRGRELGRLGGMTQGNTFHLPFADETFDKVICSEVMEHVHDFTGVARELARVTKRGGMLAITIPTATSEQLYLRVGDDYFESPGGTPYWVLRSIAQLPRADESRLVRAYRLFLIRATGSKWATTLENILNYCFPKSLILYAEKPEARRADAGA